MRAFVVREYAHPSKITLTLDAPTPTPAPGEVLVELFSSGLNFFDILQAQGKHQIKPPFPFILGNEFAGRIAQNSPVPAGCPYKPGDRVFGARQGSFADMIVANLNQLLPLPRGMTYDEGAGLFITWPTSYEALVGRARLKPGEWVLVMAAAGGVGMAAVQIAKALGAQVIAAAGSQAKLDVSKQYGGADYVIDYTKPNWQKEVLKLTDNHGVDVIFDSVGMITDSLKCIAWKGRALVVGFAAGSIEKVPMNLVLLKNVSIVGIYWGAYALKEPGHIPSVWKNLFNLFGSGRVRPVIFSTTYSLENVVDGLAALERRETWGKAVVRVKEDENVELAKL